MSHRRPSSKHPAPPMIPDASSSSSVADPILSWGSSVSVSEDLRKSIKIEIVEIDTCLGDLQGGVKHEDRTSSQVSKDLAHARVEMANLRRSAAEERDSATMNEHLRHRLADSQAELVRSMDDSTTTDHTHGSTTDDASSEAPSLETEDESEDPPPTLTTSAYLARGVARVAHLMEALHEERVACTHSMASLKEFQHTQEAVRHRISNDRLVEERDAAQTNCAFRQKEKDAELQRKASTVDAIQQARTQCGQHAQEIATLTKTATANKNKLAEEEAALVAAIETREAECKHKTEENAALESGLGTSTTKVDECTKLLEDFDATRQSIAETILARDKAKVEIKEVAPTKEALQTKMSAAQKIHEATATDLQESRECKAALEAERLQNEKLEADRVRPGQAEMLELTKESEYLAKLVSELHESTPDEKEQNKLVDADAETLVRLQTDFKTTNEEIQVQTKLLQDTEHNNEEATGQTEDKVVAHADYKGNFDEAKAAEQERIEQFQRQAKIKHDETLRTLGEENQQVKLEVERNQAVSHYGMEMLRKTEKTVKKYLLVAA